MPEIGMKRKQSVKTPTVLTVKILRGSMIDFSRSRPKKIHSPRRPNRRALGHPVLNTIYTEEEEVTTYTNFQRLERRIEKVAMGKERYYAKEIPPHHSS